jgi:broad specificity phosphatase PhoE
LSFATSPDGRLDLRRLRHPADFFFVRHGESEGNRAGKILGRMDLGLSDLGREHARAAGRYFAAQLGDLPAPAGSAGDSGTSPAAAFLATSPLSRCRETAALIAEEAGLPEPRVLEDLIELDAGAFAGRGLEEIAREEPEAFGTFRVYSWEAVDGAERIASLYQRAVALWEQLVDAANAGAERVIAVTHAGFMQWLLKASFAGPEQRWMPVIKASNCGIFHCHVEPTSFEDGGDAQDGSAPLQDASEDARAAAGDPAQGFFAEWRLMNYRPY